MWPYLKLCYCRYYLSYMDKWDGVSRWSSVNSVLMKQEAGHRGKGRNRNPWKQRWRCTLHCHQTGNLKLKGSGKDGPCRWPDLNSHPAGICTSAHLFSIPSADLCYHGVGKVTRTPKRMVTPMADMQGVVIAISSPRLIQPLPWVMRISFTNLSSPVFPSLMGVLWQSVERSLNGSLGNRDGLWLHEKVLGSSHPSCDHSTSHLFRIWCVVSLC